MRSLIERDPEGARRRLPIMILEDAVLHPDFIEVQAIAAMTEQQWSYACSLVSDVHPTLRDFLLQVTWQIAACEWRDAPPKGNPEMARADRATAEAAREGLHGSTIATVEAIRERARLGGMRSDVAMLYDFSDLWSVRFAEQSWTLERCGTFFRFVDVRWDDVEPLAAEEIPLEAVDQHCSPMSRMLLRRPHILDAVEAAYPAEAPQAVVDAVLWHCRGGVSRKPCLHSQRPLDRFQDYADWPERWGTDGPAKFVELYALIREETDRLAQWWLTGRRR
jgi:hypothetical protein